MEADTYLITWKKPEGNIQTLYARNTFWGEKNSLPAHINIVLKSSRRKFYYVLSIYTLFHLTSSNDLHSLAFLLMDVHGVGKQNFSIPTSEWTHKCGSHSNWLSRSQQNAAFIFSIYFECQRKEQGISNIYFIHTLSWLTLLPFSLVCFPNRIDPQNVSLLIR